MRIRRRNYNYINFLSLRKEFIVLIYELIQNLICENILSIEWELNQNSSFYILRNQIPRKIISATYTIRVLFSALINQYFLHWMIPQNVKISRTCEQPDTTKYYTCLYYSWKFFSPRFIWNLNHFERENKNWELDHE